MAKHAKIILLSVALLVMSAGVTFVATGTTTRASPESQGNQRVPNISVSTEKEAEQLVGYRVAKPTFPDDSFKRVLFFVGPSVGVQGTKDVTQYWVKKDGSPGFIKIQQSPVVTGLLTGKAENLNGRSIERALYPAVSGRDFGLLHLYWKNEGMAYIVLVSLTGEIDEEVGESVLMSLQ